MKYWFLSVNIYNEHNAGISLTSSTYAHFKKVSLNSKKAKRSLTSVIKIATSYSV